MNTAKLKPQNAEAILREMNRKGKTGKRVTHESNKHSRLKKRFGKDDRTYSAQNKHWRRLAGIISVIAQLVSLSGAIYCLAKFVLEPTIGGVFSTLLFTSLLIGLEFLQRWTSDEFWDRAVAGVFSWSYAFINFGIIWGISALITIAGIYFISKDTQGDPQMFDDPQVSAIRAQIADLKTQNEDYKTQDQYKVSGGRDQGEIRYSFQKAIESNTSQIATLTNSLNERFGVTAQIDKESFEYHQLESSARTWFYIGFCGAALILFELCMWYRSKYDRIEYTEGVLSGEIDDDEYLADLLGKA